MKFRSPLFARILLWFAALVLLSAAGLYGLLALEHPSRQENPFLRAELETAVWLYENTTTSELKLYTDRQDTVLGGRHRLLDANGTDVVTGERFPDALTKPEGALANRTGSLLRASTASGRYHYVVWVPAGPNGPAAREWRIYLWILAMVVVLCYILAATLARPIRSLRDVVLRFGAGDLSQRSRVRRNDEIGDLGRAFDDMADRIQTLLTSERRLLQDVSHELRTPLARMGFAVELARASKDPSGALDRIKREADRLTTLVNELIEMARAEGDLRDRRIQIVDLDALVGNLVEDFGPEAEGKGVRLEARLGSRLTVRGDGALLERAVGNLISNAIRHAPKGTPIEVCVARAGGEVEITVRDCGPGVPDEQLNDIAKPFYRVDESRDRHSGGVGLGLAIARRTALLHHGDLRASNAHPGLKVTLAVAAVPASEAKKSAAAEEPEPVRS